MRACAAALAYGVLDADADGNPVLIMGDGMPTVSIVFSYPEDFVIESDPLLTIYDRDGNVLAREGDEVELGGGLNADDTIFHACGVISSDSNPPPSIECRMSAEDCDKALQAIVGVTDLRDPELQTVVVSGGTARTWHAEVHVCWSDGRYQLYDVMGPIGSDNPQLTTIPRAEMPPRLCD
jgi:hypothetical protein